jgi:hypothetical protein
MDWHLVKCFFCFAIFGPKLSICKRNYYTLVELRYRRSYDLTTGSRLPVEDYFVPCMVTKQYTTSYIKNECTPQRAICLAFVFKGSIIPPALPNRLIGAYLSMWRLKTYEGKTLLFSGFIDYILSKSLMLLLLFLVENTWNLSMQVQHGKATVVMIFCYWPTDKTPKSSPVWQTNIP